MLSILWGQVFLISGMVLSQKDMSGSNSNKDRGQAEFKNLGLNQREYLLGMRLSINIEGRWAT